jgi:predicted AlkP superfamily phosphohydrolase/phosphomutase
MSNSRSRKVAVIGLDGATFDLILPWVESGDLPNFRRLLAQSAFGPLRSTIHPLSPQAWSTFATGKNAGKHGIFDFLVKQPGTYQFALTHGGYRQEASLWRLLSQADKRVIVVNVPFTYPPEPVNGVMISGFDAPRADETFCYPFDIYERLKAAVGEYYLHEMYPVGYRMAEYEKVLQKEIENRARVTQYFLEQYEWDFYMIVMIAVDSAQHLFWAEMEHSESPFQHLIRHVYQAADTAVGEIWSMLGDEVTLIIMSDHGAGPIGKTVHLNEWLYQHHWLVYDEQPAAVGRRLVSRWVNAGRVTLKRHLPRSAKDWLKQRAPGFRSRTESWLQTSDIDWSRTRAFSGGNFGNIYVNLRGREPQGIVQPGGEYNKLLSEITTALLDMRDPDTGIPVVERVHRREELYNGPFLDLAPDLIIQWRNYAYLTAPGLGSIRKPIFAPPLPEDATEFEHTGTHRLDGILLITGPDIQPGSVEGAHIADLAPTTLHALGLPVPEDMDGRVLQSVFRTETPVNFGAPSNTSGGNGPGSVASTYSESEEAEMVERLRALGYITV